MHLHWVLGCYRLVAQSGILDIWLKAVELLWSLHSVFFFHDCEILLVYLTHCTLRLSVIIHDKT